MKTDRISQVASCLLVFFFLFNDLHASARALSHWGEVQPISPTLNKSGHINKESRNLSKSNSGARRNTPIHQTQSVQENEVLDLSEVQSFAVPALEDEALIGMELNMPLNDPQDDIFNFQLPKNFNPVDWSSVYLTYEVNGVEDGRSLAKSFNSNETFGERSLVKDDSWHQVREKIAASDLKEGLNYLRFTVPSGLGISAQIKSPKLEFQRQADGAMQSPRLERVVVEDPTFFQAIPAMETVQAYRLREVEMPVLPQGIINITSGAKAYQPSPQVAAQAEQIGFKLNIAQLNSQQKLSELQVYYFDYSTKSWQGVAIDSIDTNGEIAFVPNKGQTQYFGALIKSPEMPETSAFAPTMIQDIEAANPASGMNLMQPPGISRTGEASMSYPLEIPAGRKGMQPQLALSYNSDAGSSWAGYGWNIGVSSISVDTKWGVPTFDATEQTEMYLMDGEKLFEEGGNRANRTKYNRTVPTPSEPSTYYFKKQIGSYQTIERFGNSPDTYYWVVTKADGTKFTYGRYSSSYSYDLGSGTISVHDYQPVLKDTDSNIVKWGLTEIEDVNGNKVVYTYERLKLHNALLYENTPQYNTTVWVPKGIFYTGTGASLGKYMIEFQTEADRVDAMINAKYGFKLLDDRRLKSIKVRFQTENSTNYSVIIKSWDLFHTDESEGNTYQYKALLTSLKENRGPSQTEFYKHTFTYHSGDLEFEDQNDDYQVIEVNTFNNSLLGKNADFVLSFIPIGPILTKIFWPSSLGTSTTKSHDYALSPGIGFSPKPASSQSKNFTINLKLGGTSASTRQKTGFQDFDGDGLPDLMQEQERGDGDKFYYFPLRRKEDGTYYLGSKRTIDASELGHTSSSEFNIGFEAMADLLLAQFSYGLNWNTSNSYTDKYLFDYNADGILDLVQNRTETESYVYFGVLDGMGNLTFDLHSENSLSPTIQTEIRPTIDNDYPDPNMGAEIVRIWEAPESGSISISGFAKLTSAAQGPVEIAIQKNRNKSYVVPFQTINSTSPTAITVSHNGINKGDVFMFRVRSGETSFEDLVEWDPQITYTGGTDLLVQKDGAGNELLSTKASDGFLLSGGTAATIPGDRGVKIDWEDINLSGFSDDVQFRVHVSAYDQTNTTDTAAYYRETFVNTIGNGNTKWIYADQYDFDPLSGGTDLLEQLGNTNPFDFLSTVSNPEDYLVYISFSIFSTSNLKWTDIDWRPVVTISSEICGGGEEFDDYPIVNYRTYNYFSQTQDPIDFSPYSTSARVWPTFPGTSTVQAAFSGTSYSTMTAFLTIKGDESLITKAKAVFSASTGLVSLYTTDANGDAVTALPSSTSASGSFDFVPNTINGKDEVYVEWHSDFEELESILQATNLDLIAMSNGAVLSADLNHSIFIRVRSILNDNWLHWGRFMWNDLDRVANTPIETNYFKLPTESIATANDFSDITEAPSKEDMEAIFGTSEQPEIYFFPLMPVRGEINFDDREYIRSAASYPTNPENLDRYAVINSHSAEYRVPGMITPWLLTEPDIAIESPSTDPITDDMVQGMRVKNHSYSLGDNYSAGYPPDFHPNLDVSLGLSRSINGSSFFNHTETMTDDFNGDGFPDLWQTDDVGIVLTDPRGGMNSAVTNITSGYKYKSQNTQAALVAMGSTINESFLHYCVTPDAANNPTDIQGLKNLGSSIAKNGGNSETQVNWFDINGDGLPDKVTQGNSPGQLNVNYNLGNGIDAESYLITPNNNVEIIRNSIVELDFSTPVTRRLSTLAPTIFPDNLDDISIQSKSYRAGLSANRKTEHKEVFYFDLNGDGLLDAVVETPSESIAQYSVFLNKGISFSTSPIIIDNIPTYYGQTNVFTVNAGGSGTYAFPAFTVPPVGHFKVAVNGQYSYAYSAQLTKSSFADMNGDGYPDMMTTNEDEEIEVFHNKLGKALKLESVTNPLGGSFTLDYEVIGNKSGYYTAEITSHNSPADEDVYWDMPQGKWVLSALEIFDGYNITNGGSDVDGADYQRFTFNYDGGVHSRREREFLGFSRIEQNYEPLEKNYYDGMPLKPITDPDYIANEGCYNLIDDETKFSSYYSQVYIYESLKEGTFEARKEFEYKKGVLLDQFSYLNYEVYQVWFTEDPICSSLPDRIEQTDRARHLISHQENRYNYYQVSQSHTNPSKIEQDVNSDLVFADFSTIDEESSVFPAIMNTLTYVHPEIDTSEAFYSTAQNPVTEVQASTYIVEEYDEYFNILRYTRGAGNVVNSFNQTLKETIDYTKIEEYPTYVLVKFAYNSQTQEYYYQVNNPHGAATAIPGFKSGFDVYELAGPSGFDTDTIFLPLDFLITGCGFTPRNDEEWFPVQFTFRKVLNKQIKVYENNLTTTLTADLIADMEYHSPISAAGKTSVLKTHEIRVNSSASSPKRRTTTLVDAFGQISHIRKHLVTTGSNAYAETELSYNSMGQVIKIKGPANHQAQRFELNYTYDSHLSKYITKVSNSFGEEVCNIYDSFGIGLLMQSTDINGSPMRYTYDEFFRPKRIYSPKALSDVNPEPTIVFEYYPQGIDPLVVHFEQNIPVALTYHNINRTEEYNSSYSKPACQSLIAEASLEEEITSAYPLETAVFIDGLGATLQTKSSSSWHVNGQEGLNREISGFVTKNIYGWPTASYISHLERASLATTLEPLGELNLDFSDLVSTIQYDYLGRTLKNRLIREGASTLYDHSTYDYYWSKIGLDFVFVSDVQSPDGVRTKSYTDQLGRQVQLDKYRGNNGGAMVIDETKFSYDPLGQVSNFTSPASEICSYTYDEFGRVLTETHPDRDSSVYTYDMSGNLTDLENGDNQILEMKYHYNRLVEKNYPETGDLNDVIYTYGTPASTVNGTGRIVKVEQGTDFMVEEYEYDDMGNVIDEYKLIRIPQAGPQEFTTQFTYDEWGRVRSMVYPDGENVSYIYNNMGDLDQMEANVGLSNNFTILDEVLYDGYGNMESYTYGNGSVNTLEYDQYTRRMISSALQLNPSTGPPVLALDKSYTYDFNGNVSAIENTAPGHATGLSTLGGIYTLDDIVYDDMNQLTSAKLRYQRTGSSFGGTLDHDLTLQTSYFSAGRLDEKKIVNANSVSPNYSFDYQYNGNSDHQVSAISATYDASNTRLGDYAFTYNASGSIVTKTYHETNAGNHAVNQFNRFCWTEDQRLRAVLQRHYADQEGEELTNFSAHYYAYDHTGNRVLKINMDESLVGVNSNSEVSLVMDPPTVYVNPYYIANHYLETVLASKHYYMGSQRIATNLLAEEFDHSNPILELIPAEGDTGYTPVNSAIVQDIIGALNCLYDGAELTVNTEEMLYLPSIGESFVFTDDEGAETTDPQEIETGYLTCEQSLYWATLGGVECGEPGVMYWYHPDYLGSVEFVSDLRGNSYQFFLNTPWGENLENQFARNYTAFSSRFRFNGKEWDDETGNFYYGARYYDPKISVWLSVDPKAADYPYISPYNFVENSPLILVDPDGNGPWFIGKGFSNLSWLSKASNWVSKQYNAAKSWVQSIGDPKYSMELDPVTVKPVSRPVFHDDYTGYIRGASQAEWDVDPAYAFLIDASAVALNVFSPAGAIDDAVVVYNDENSTPQNLFNAAINVILSSGGGKGGRGRAGSYSPNMKLRRNRFGEPSVDPDVSGPHTQLGRRTGKKGDVYTQGMEFDQYGKPVRQIDFTDHGRSNHPNPHQHKYSETPTGGTRQRGPAEPLDNF